MPDVHCIPVYLYSTKALHFSRCSVVPGLIIKKYEGQLKKKIDDFSKKLPQPLKVNPSHLICIDEDVYLAKLKERLKTEGKEFPKRPWRFIDSFSLAKQAVMALILSGPVSFSMHGKFSFSRKGSRYQLLGYYNTAHFEVYPIMSTAMFKERTGIKNVSANQVTRYGKLLDEYYRDDIWSIDRYAMALAHFWGALCTQFVDQALLGLMLTLECLLSTSIIEIAHTLAERSAFILKQTPNERLAKYKEVKKIYDYRSKLVHGKAFVRKGIINLDSLYVSPKMMTVPVSIRGQAFNIALNILTAILNDKKIITIIQKRKSEEEITKELHSFYISALFNAS